MSEGAGRVLRVAVLVAAVASSLATLSSTAGAVIWHNAGSTIFTATGGPGTLSTGGLGPLFCTGSTATGSAPGGTVTSFSIVGTATFAPCTLGVSTNWYVHCFYAFSATSQTANATAGDAAVTCDLRVNVDPFPAVCHISGTTPASYLNPSGSTPGRLTLNTSAFAGTLQVSDAATSCPMGTGPASWSEQTLQVTTGSPTTLGPVVTRTP